MIKMHRNRKTQVSLIHCSGWGSIFIKYQMYTNIGARQDIGNGVVHGSVNMIRIVASVHPPPHPSPPRTDINVSPSSPHHLRFGLPSPEPSLLQVASSATFPRYVPNMTASGPIPTNQKLSTVPLHHLKPKYTKSMIW